MIFHKALVREFANTALATFFVLVGITLTTQLVKLLSQAAMGAITSKVVLALLGLMLVNYLPVLLSLTTFIAILMTLTRSYRDSEMVVWFSSGLGLMRWMRPVLAFAVPLVLVIGLLSLVLSPWAVTRSEELRRMMDSRDDVSAIVPGVFRESGRADRVYFVEEVSDSENEVANVFVSSNQHQKVGVMVARRGYQETAENGDRFLVLLNGRRYEGAPGTAEYRVFEFERYAMRVEVGEARARAPTTKTTPTVDLVKDPDAAQSGRAFVACRSSDERAGALAARDTAFLRQSACRPIHEPRAGARPLHDLQQSAVDHPGLDRTVARELHRRPGRARPDALHTRGAFLPAAYRRFVAASFPMRTLRRYLAREIGMATALVALALLMLFSFFDLVEEMKDLGRGNYRLKNIALHVLLSVPTHVYEVFPIAALIGTLFALAQLVASSEYTVMRTSGVSLLRLNAALLSVGLLFATVTFAFGEFIGPPAEQFAQRMRSLAIAGIVAQEFRSGLWVKDGRNFVNVGEVTPDADLKRIRIYEFDDEYRLQTLSLVEEAAYVKDRIWTLKGVVQTTFDGQRTIVRRVERLEWNSVLEPQLLSMLLVKPDRMSAWSLYSYSQHLRENRQKALRYEIALWMKIMYPVAVLAMVLLAVPFASFQKRQGGVGARIFTGIMLGLAFYTMNRLFGSLGLLYDWPAPVAAVTPTLLFLALALTMMWWQEKR